jgi:hypothetical protein
MHFDLFATDPALQPLVSDRKVPTVEPLPVSPWVAMSAMQKSIRRGDVDLALRAAASLLEKDATKLWRRLVGIVFEDVGLGSVETIRLVMAATAGKSFRHQFDGEWAVASLLVERMCAAPACRAADDLFIAVSHHHELEEVRAELAARSLPQHLSHVRERSAILGCAIASLHASGVRWTGKVAGKAADPKALFDAMREAGADTEIVALAERGYRKTGEPLPLLLPFLSCAFPSGQLPAVDDEFPPVVIGRSGLPTYVLDGFSWEGKAALAGFLKRETKTGRWLRSHVPAERRLAVLAGGLFRIDGGLVRQRVEWPCAMTLRWLADSGFHDTKLADPLAVLDMIRADLPTIDEERADVR